MNYRKIKYYKKNLSKLQNSTINSNKIYYNTKKGGMSMELNIFKNIKEEIENRIDVKSFIEELTNFLKNIESPKANIKEDLQEYRKEGHLYLVTEDRNNEIYLSDFTDSSKIEFKETNLPKEILQEAKEGTMLQYKNGKYEIYSQNGYDMLFKNN